MAPPRLRASFGEAPTGAFEVGGVGGAVAEAGVGVGLEGAEVTVTSGGGGIPTGREGLLRET